jgi:hypothetical protein
VATIHFYSFQAVVLGNLDSPIQSNNHCGSDEATFLLVGSLGRKEMYSCFFRTNRASCVCQLPTKTANSVMLHLLSLLYVTVNCHQIAAQSRFEFVPLCHLHLSCHHNMRIIFVGFVSFLETTTLSWCTIIFLLVNLFLFHR